MNHEPVGSIVVITGDDRTRSTLDRELRKRYAADYAVQAVGAVGDVRFEDGAPPNPSSRRSPSAAWTAG